VSFTPPPYPYERLDVLKKLAEHHEGAPIDCSIGTPVDPPPAAVLEELARGVGARGYPTSQGSLDFRVSAADWMNRRFGLELAPDQLAACIGTKEFVGTVSGYLHLRSPERDTVLYPAVSYPTYAMGATLAGLRPVGFDGEFDHSTSARSMSGAGAVVELAVEPDRSPRRPRGRRHLGPPPRRAGRE
jgi:aspartate/methionine/tyrosine aminotransferase